jgi:hypothetical protein
VGIGRPRKLLAAAAMVAGPLALLAAGPSTGTTRAGAARCPIAAVTGASGPVQWAFSETGPPSGSHPGIASSYTHGHGSWAGGRAHGTICHQDSARHAASRDLVLSVSGAARLAPGVFRLGLRGVQLTLSVQVSASDDRACPTGAMGSVTLFASYHEVHRDSLRLHFAGACSSHDHLYTGAALHVLIARNGHQVNSL